MSKTYKEIVATIKAELKAGVETCRSENKGCYLHKMMLRDPEKYTAAYEAHRALPFNGTHFDSQSWRIKHIAYCLFRGRTMEQIEKGWEFSSSAKQAHYYAKKWVEEWSEEAAEDIAAYKARKAAKAEVPNA